VRDTALQVVIVTGLSGSGKSTAIRVLEDLGFYCIDNLPVVLTPKFIELCQNSEEEINRVALPALPPPARESGAAPMNVLAGVASETPRLA
jgi:hypothetical protein